MNHPYTEVIGFFYTTYFFAPWTGERWRTRNAHVSGSEKGWGSKAQAWTSAIPQPTTLLIFISDCKISKLHWNFSSRLHHWKWRLWDQQGLRQPGMETVAIEQFTWTIVEWFYLQDFPRSWSMQIRNICASYRSRTFASSNNCWTWPRTVFNSLSRGFISATIAAFTAELLQTWKAKSKSIFVMSQKSEWLLMRICKKILLLYTGIMWWALWISIRHSNWGHDMVEDLPLLSRLDSLWSPNVILSMTFKQEFTDRHQNIVSCYTVITGFSHNRRRKNIEKLSRTQP